MSVASEFAPEVSIPARARGRGRAVAEPARALRLVTPSREAMWSAVPRPAVTILPSASPDARVLLPRRGPRAAVTGSSVRLLGASAPARALTCPAPRPAVSPAVPTLRAAPSASARRSAVRLTRRGTVVLSVAVLGLGTLMLLVAHLSLGSADAVASPVSAAPVTVQAGDTLWSIAQRVAPNRDPRPVVSRLRSVNHLGTVALTPGQTLKVG